MLIQRNKQLGLFIINIQASYAWLYNSVDFIVNSHKIHLVGRLTKTKGKNKVTQEVDEYLGQFRQISTKGDL